MGLVNQNDERILEVGIVEELRVSLDFMINEECEEIYFTIAILNELKNTECLWSKSNDSDRYSFKNINPGRHWVVLTYKEHHLGPGVECINYNILNGITGESYEHGFKNVSFAVKSAEHFERGFLLA